MNAERLLTLADHLDGKLSVDRFTLNHFHAPGNPAYNCGTSGCAMGELPAMYPKVWEYRQDCNLLSYEVRLIDSPTYGVYAPHCTSFMDGMKWFDINEDEIYLLFVGQNKAFEEASPTLMVINGVTIYAPNDDATAGEVAINIRKFVRAKQMTHGDA